MKYYMGVQFVQAEIAMKSEFIPVEAEKDVEGYCIKNTNKWISKEEFESIYLPLTRPDSIIENDLDSFVGSMSEAFSIDKLDAKTTMVRMETRTGYVDYATSSCVDPANCNHDIGINNCLGELKNRLWPMLEFVLQWAKYGLKPIK